MAFTPMVGCTGFEPGSITIIGSTNRVGATIKTTPVHTGTYSVELRGMYLTDAWMRWSISGSPAELYVGMWVRPVDVSPHYQDISVYGGGYYVGLRHDGTYWDAYVNDGKVADGTVVHVASSWHFVELHVIIDNAGTIESKIDGVLDISYSGDTQVGASTAITWLRALQHCSGLVNDKISFWDDVSFGSGDWPGDIRYATLLVPNADTADNDWAPSSGSLAYAMIDETPPSDADYISAGSTGYKTLSALSNWSPSNASPLFVVDWMRAKKDAADAGYIASIIKSGGTESSGGSQALTTGFEYYSRILTTDPDTAAPWTEGGINALWGGEEYV